MVKSISEEGVRQALAKLMHREINYSLIDLGMSKDGLLETMELRLR